MLFSIFLTTLLNKAIVCYEDSNESRYIDLLPEEEKEQFLESIARRILEDGNVNNDNKDKHSVEITEHQLNEHDEFVEKILKEESENIRRNNDNGNNNDENGENGESEIVKSFDKNDHALEDGKGIDLAVTNEKVNSLDTTNANNETFIDVAVRYDNENLDPEKQDTETPVSLAANENKKINISEKGKSIENVPDKSNTEDTQVKNIQDRYVEEIDDNENYGATIIDKDSDAVTFYTDKAEYITETTTAPRQQENSTDEDNYQRITENPEPELETLNAEVKTTAHNNELDLDKDIIKDDTITELSTTELTKSLPQSKLRSGAAINTHNEDLTLLQNPGENTSNLDGFLKNKTRQSSTNLIPNTNDTSGYKIKNESVEINQSKVDIQNVEPSLELETVAINTTRAKKNIIEPEKNSNKDSLDLMKAGESKHDVGKDFVKALRFNILQDMPSDNYNIDPSKHSEEQNTSVKSTLKEYNVYKIPEDKPVFTQKGNSKSPPNKDQPYYVPIYNYSPNHAYFNAQNRLGPNLDDENLESSKEYYNKRKFNFVKRIFSNTKWKNDKKPKHVRHSVRKKKAYLPVKKIIPGNDVDAVYYLGRREAPYFWDQSKDKSKQKLPASDEDAHPFSNFNKVKSHIRAIRHILFKQKRFGYVKKVNSSELKSSENGDYVETATTIPYLKLKRERTNVAPSDDSRISMDYLRPLKLSSSINGQTDILPMKLGYIKYSDDIKNIYLLSEPFKNNKIKDSNKEHFNRAKLAKYSNNDLRVKSYSPTFKSDNKSEHLYDPFKTIMDMTDAKDLLQTLVKLKALNMTNTRSNNVSEELEAYVEVMKDMIYQDSRALKQYDWLSTTVDIQAAVKKLQDLIQSLQDSKKLHPSDLHLLKYTILLYSGSKMPVKTDTNVHVSHIKLRNKLFPKTKKPRKNYLKDKGLINRVWLLRRKDIFECISRELFLLNDFLYDLRNALYDLHDAIKNIASVTNVSNQRWFENIKELYLNGDRRQLVKIVLHLTATRLFDMIEENSVDIEENLEIFLKNNEEVFKETVEELKFIIVLLKEIKRLN